MKDFLYRIYQRYAHFTFLGLIISPKEGVGVRRSVDPSGRYQFFLWGMYEDDNDDNVKEIR